MPTQLLTMSPVHHTKDTGLFRTRVTGHNASTRQAFQRLTTLPNHLSSWQASIAGLSGAGIPVSDDSAEGQWDLINLRNEVFIVVAQGKYRRLRVEGIPPEGLVELHFVLEGASAIGFDDNGDCQVTGPTLTVVRQHETTRHHVHCGPGIWRSVSLFLPVETFDSALADGPGHQLLERAHSGHELSLPCFLQLPLPPQALQPLERLLTNPYQGSRRLLFAEAKASELLCLAIDLCERQLCSQAAPNLPSRYSSRDLVRLEQVRSLLLTDLSRTPTTQQLAQAVGLEPTRLKNGFRHVYGMSIAELAQRYRMSHAYDLLQDGCAMTEVASRVGFRNLTAFSRAFKDHFGMVAHEAKLPPQP